MILSELRKVIPSFLKRVDLPDRGGATSAYMTATREGVADLAARIFPDDGDDTGPTEPGVELVDWDPDGEIKVVAAMLYPHTDQPESRVEARVRSMGVDERLAVIRAYVGQRTNRRHRPGRAFERTGYRFDVLADYGAFRDLQRHRMLTIDWQALSPRHGYTRPEALAAAGLADEFDQAMERSAELYDALAEPFPQQAPYAVSLAYRLRFSMQMNAREAMHTLELRSTPQGHPAYRTVAQDMHRLIAEKAGHRALAEAMSFVDHSPEPGLERLDSERRAERRRASR
jgi:hypothetical protein